MVISHHAPKGHVAVKTAPAGLPCDGCAFKYVSMCPNIMGTPCTSARRKDGQNVIFVPTLSK